MAGLSFYEQETIISFNEEEDIADVYTANGKLKRKMKKFAEEYPDLCKLIGRDSFGIEEYHVKKDRLSINVKKPLTEEQRSKFAETARERFWKAHNINSEPKT